MTTVSRQSILPHSPFGFKYALIKQYVEPTEIAFIQLGTKLGYISINAKWRICLNRRGEYVASFIDNLINWDFANTHLV
jgi:hypothetical protein